MNNSNCLENISCPKCGNEKAFIIHVTTQAHVTDDGAEPFGDIEWDENSPIACPCGKFGKLYEFTCEQSAAETPMRENPTLPPDPDDKNNDRARWAQTALDAYMKETGTDLEDALGDLLCDLLHLSDRELFDFAAALIRAEHHYLAETGQPGPYTW